MKSLIFAVLFFTSIVSFAQTPQLIISQTHADPIYSIAHTDDEKYVATSSVGVVKIWENKSGKLLKTIDPVARFKRILVTIPNRNVIGEMTADGIFNLIGFPSLEEKNLFVVGSGFFKCVSMIATKDGRYVFASGRNWDSQTSDHGVIFRIDMKANSYTLVYKQPHTGEPGKNIVSFKNLRLSPDNKYLFASYLCGETVPNDDSYIFDVQTSKVVKQWKSNSTTYYFAGNNQLLHTKLLQNTSGKPLIVGFELLQIPSMQTQRSFELPYYTNSHEDNLDCHFDPATNLFTFTSGNDVVQVDIQTEQVKTKPVFIQKNRKAWSGITAIDFLSKGNNMIISYEKDGAVGKVDVINRNTLEKVKQIGNDASFKAMHIRNHPARNMFSLSDEGSQVKFIDLLPADIKILNPAFGSKTSVNWSPDGKKAAFHDVVNQTLGIVDANHLTAAPRTIKWDENKDAKNLVWSPDSRYFAIGTGRQISVFNAASLAVAQRLAGNEKFASPVDHQYINFSNNGKYLVATVMRPDNGYKDAETVPINFVVCYDVLSGEKLWETNMGAFEYCCYLTFSTDDKSIIFLQRKSGRFIYMDASTGKVEEKLEVTFGSNIKTHSGTISADAKRGAFALGNEIYVCDLVKKTKIAKLSLSYFHPKNLCFLPNKNFLAVLYETNAIHIFNIAQQKEVARIFTFQNGNDWVVTTADGRFDATEGAMNNMYYVKNADIIPLNALYEKFYTPNLLSRILEQDKFEPAPVDINTLIAAPTVKISIENQQRNLTVGDDIPSYVLQKDQVLVKVQADCPGDAVTEIRLYQNGKLVQTTRNLVVEDDSKGIKSLTKTFSIVLNPGANHFRAVAFNTQRTESEPDEMDVAYKASVTPQNVEEKAQLYVLVIGINKYKNQKYNLNYATADATSFKEALEKGSAPIFSNSKMFFIADENATKENITSALNEIKMKATNKDVFLFYYAGHGVMNDKKEFYLVPTDVTQLYGADGALSQKGISSGLLQQYSKDIRAQKQLFILDACQSAGALEQLVSARGAAEEKAIAQLARSTGTHWFTASGSTQFAAEFKELGHGVFTYCLLEAMKGAGDNGDKKITVKELDAYLQTSVPELTQKYKGGAQYPASYGYGNDFPMIIVK